MANAELVDWAALQQQAAAEAGTGTLTAQQETDLNREQANVFNKITGKQCLYLLQLAAQQRVHVLGDTVTVPTNVRFYPHTLIAGFRAIEFLSDRQCLAMLKVLQEAVNGPSDPLEIKRQNPAHVLDTETVYELYMKAFAAVATNSMLPPVPAAPANTLYQRAVVIALTVNLKSRFMESLANKKSNNELRAELRAEFSTKYGPTSGSSSGGGASSNGGSPYNGPANKNNGKGGKGAGKGKGKPAGGKGGANGVDTCLDWIESKCSGTGRSTCPKGHLHSGSLQKLTWLNARMLEGRVSDEVLWTKSREADRS